MKKRKIQANSLPVDCVGEISGFITSTKLFFKLHGLSKHVKWYFNNEVLVENIHFVGKGDFVVTNELRYVGTATLKSPFLVFKKFPRIRNLRVDCGSNIPALEKGGRFRDLPELSYLSRLEIVSKNSNKMHHSFSEFSDDEDSNEDDRRIAKGNEPSLIIGDKDFVHFRNLTDLRIEVFNCGVTDEGLSHLVHVEKLVIVNLYNSTKFVVTGECFRNMKKLRELAIRDVKSSALKYLTKIRKLYCEFSKIGENEWKHLEELESLSLRSTGISIDGWKCLPQENLRELSLKTNRSLHSVGNLRGVQGFRNLEIVRFVVDNSTDVTYILDNVMSEKLLVLYIGCMVHPKDSYFYYGDSTFLLTIDAVQDTHLSTIAEKFLYLKTLEIFHCGSNVTDDGIRVIEKDFEELEKFLLDGNEKVTRSENGGLEQLKRVKEVVVSDTVDMFTFDMYRPCF